MTEQGTVAGWVWVIIEKEGDQEKLLALKDENKGVSFIPAFQTKEDGVVGQRGFPAKPGIKFELEAMRLSLVSEAARANHYDIYIIDHSGKVLEWLTPAPDA
ncbi:MAG: hypothetical protein SV487_09865 [Thermodesulfobacteriota bacterium]|nr:hypothetical protein [Thermodesulfobacteriota bacterium]